jgi:hypothetical protein
MMNAKMMASGGPAKAKMMASGGMSKKGYAAGGAVKKKGAASGGVSEKAAPQGTVTSKPVKTTVPGDKVQVRGVGAARARTAMIY